jgi:ubiquinone/menaquinone biosynthesis C-methylase UbiE
MKREFSQSQPELMDVAEPGSPELEESLRNLASMNRHFGAHRLIRRFLKAWFAPGETYRVLDLATGAGDIPRMMLEWGQPRGIRFEIDAVDANPATIEVARKMTPYPQVNWIAADALTYGPGRTYDLVCCSLALHHFAQADAVRLLRRCQRLSHRFTLVADLERSPLNYFCIWLVTALIYRDPITRHDGLISAKRAFSYDELAELASEAGWEVFEQCRFPPCRQAIWMVTDDLGDIPAPVLEEVAPLPCPT